MWPLALCIATQTSSGLLQALQSLAEQQVQQPVHTASKISFEPVARVDVILPDGPESTPPPISASSSAPSPSQQPPSAREAFEVSPTGATGPQIPGAFASEVDSTEDHVEVEKGATPLGTVLQALLSEENSKALRAVLVDGYEEYAVVDEMIRTLEEMQRLKREMEVAQR